MTKRKEDAVTEFAVRLLTRRLGEEAAKAFVESVRVPTALNQAAIALFLGEITASDAEVAALKRQIKSLTEEGVLDLTATFPEG